MANKSLLLDDAEKWPEYIQIERDGQVLLSGCFSAVSWLNRARGLIKRPPEFAREGLILAPCSSVHNMFMSYSIDLVFINKKGLITKVQKDFKPWKAYAGSFTAWAVLELLAGRANELAFEKGQQLTFRAPNQNNNN